jgi:hypothetical protein
MAAILIEYRFWEPECYVTEEKNTDKEAESQPAMLLKRGVD